MRIFKDNLSTFTHWYAWTFSFIASIIFGIFLFGEDIPQILSGENKEMIWFVILLLAAIAGTILSFFNRIYGGAAQVLFGIGLVLFFYFLTGWKDAKMMVLYGLPYILPGFLLLVVKK